MRQTAAAKAALVRPLPGDAAMIRTLRFGLLLALAAVMVFVGWTIMRSVGRVEV